MITTDSEYIYWEGNEHDLPVELMTCAAGDECHLGGDQWDAYTLASAGLAYGKFHLKRRRRVTHTEAIHF